MIFIGNGNLLKNAIQFVLQKKKYNIDYVFTQTKEVFRVCNENGIPYKETTVDSEKNIFIECSDNVAFSINNNEQIIKEPLLSLGVKFYNIHNGIIPKYRGYPIACIIYAILNSEETYGVSLHEIDKGIDTGKCIDQITFPIESLDNFETVMNQSLIMCDEIFKDNLDAIMQENIKHKDFETSVSKLYTKKSLSRLGEYKNNPRIEAATYFGIYNLWFGQLNKVIKESISLGSIKN